MGYSLYAQELLEPVSPRGAGPGHPAETWGDPVDGAGPGHPDRDAPAPSEDVSRSQMREVHRTWFARSESQKGCGRDVVPLGNPQIWRDPDGGRCWISGVKTCGNRWACPVCARGQAVEKSQEIKATLERHRKAGGEALFVTATLPHHAGHECEDVRRAVSESWSYLLGGSPWKRWGERLGYLGQIRVLEVTIGPNGWHWHVHALLLIEGAEPRELADAWIEDDDLEGGEGPGGSWRPSLLCWIRNRWERRIRTWFLEDGELERQNLNRGGELLDGREPLFGEPARDRGVRIVQADADAGRYVGKMGMGRELSRMDLKRGHTAGHRTPFQLLRDVCRWWKPEDRRRWQEYVDATEGKAQSYTSPAVRDRYASEEQLDLEDKLEAEPDLLLEIQGRLWRLASKMRDAADLRAVRRAEIGGAEAVVAWLEEIVDEAGLEEVVAWSRDKALCWLREPIPGPDPPEPDPQSDLWQRAA